jgi:hypothetical protein
MVKINPLNDNGNTPEEPMKRFRVTRTTLEIVITGILGLAVEIADIQEIRQGGIAWSSWSTICCDWERTSGINLQQCVFGV